MTHSCHTVVLFIKIIATMTYNGMVARLLDGVLLTDVQSTAFCIIQ